MPKIAKNLLAESKKIGQLYLKGRQFNKPADVKMMDQYWHEQHKVIKGNCKSLRETKSMPHHVLHRRRKKRPEWKGLVR